MPTKLSAIKPNPHLIKDDKFALLVSNILRYPKFLRERPIVHKDGIIQGGNIRYKALKQIPDQPNYERVSSRLGGERLMGE